jgi:hypothetical protein
MDCLVPGSICKYVAYSDRHGQTTVEDFRVTLVIDYPPNADFDKEQQLLEDQAQKSRTTYLESIKSLQR